MDSRLKQKLITASAGGVIAIAAALGAWYEGEGPTKLIDGVRWSISYQDVVGVWTVCRGLTGPVAGPGKRYTEDQCRMLEEQRLGVTRIQTARQLPRFDTYDQWRQAALIDFTYNMGESALASSTMRAKFNAGDADGGCRELAKWVKARVKGVLTTLRGLVLRRADEMELCLEGVQ